MQINTLFRSVRWTKYVSLKNLIQRTMPLREVCILYSPESCSGRAYSTSLGQHVSLYRMVHHINVVFFCRLKADVFTSRDQCQRSKCKVPFLINVLRVYKDKSFFLDFANLSYIFKSTKQFWTRRIQRYPIFSGFVPSTVAASERVSRHPRLSKQDDDRKNHERNYYCSFKDNRRRAVSSSFFDLLSHILSYDPQQLQQQYVSSEMT